MFLFDQSIYAQFRILNLNIVVLKDYVDVGITCNRGNKNEEFICLPIFEGFKVSSFIFFKKIAFLHDNNRILRKRRLKRLQMRQKSIGVKLVLRNK